METLRISSESFTDLSNYCRTCFRECKDEGCNVAELSKQLYRLFMQCVPYERSQKNLTNILCPLCYDALKTFEEFRSKALVRSYLLERHLKARYLDTVPNKHKAEIFSDFSKVHNCSAQKLDSINEQNDTGSTEHYEQEEEFQKLDSDSVQFENESMVYRIPNEEHDLDIIDKFIFSDNETQNYDDGNTIDNKHLLSRRTSKKGISKKKYFRNDGLYSCSHCDRTFQYSMSLSKHLTEAHNLKPTFTFCPYKNCKKTFQHSLTATQHYQIFHIQPVQKDTLCICELCGQTFENEETLNCHRRVEHCPTADTEICNDEHSEVIDNQSRNENFEKDSRQKMSLKKVAEADSSRQPKNRLYSCSYCDRSYYNSMSLSKHLTETHNLESTFTVCPHADCSKTFKHEEAASQHYRYHHQLEIQNVGSYICELCGQTFETEQKLKHHHYKHKPDARPFHCELCDKRFVLKRYLKEHQLRHAGIKEFECPHCKMKKTSARELRAHMNVHSNDIQYTCPLCPRIFRWPQALQNHDRIVHKGIRRYICRYCDQAFGKPENLKYHERRHTGEKPFECVPCELKFISLSALQTHNKTKSHNKKTNDRILSRIPKLRESSKEVDVINT